MDKNKTIPQLLEEIAEDLCTNYCKYPVLADDPEDWAEKTCNGENEICNNCPLNRLT